MSASSDSPSKELRAFLLSRDNERLTQTPGTQKELAALIAAATGMLPSTAETSLSRLLREGRHVERLRGALEAIERPPDAGSRKRVSVLLDEIQSRRMGKRVASESAGALAEVFAAVENTTSQLVSYPVYPFSQASTSVMEMRLQIVDRMRLYDRSRKPVSRTMCFVSSSDAFEWLRNLLLDSVACPENKGRLNRKALEKELLSMEAGGYFRVKVLHPFACMTHATLVNTRGVGQLAGFVWSYNQEAKISWMHPIDSFYLRHYDAWARAIEADDHRLVVGSIDLGRCIEEMSKGRQVAGPTDFLQSVRSSANTDSQG